MRKYCFKVKSKVTFVSYYLFQITFIKPCSDERQNGFKSLKLKRCKFLQPSFTPREHVCFCLKPHKHFRFKCLRRFSKTSFF